MTDGGEDHDRPGALAALELFVGIWNTTGTIRPSGDEPAQTLLATDIYEWLPGRHFLLHRVDARMGGAPSRSIEIVHWDAARGTCMSRSYDDQGSISDYQCALADRHWSIRGDSVRFAGDFDESGDRLTGLWELRGEDGRWRPWIDLELVRAG